MSDIVISAENLGKKYIIGHQNQQESYTALRDVVGRTIKGLARSAQDMIHGRAIVPGDNLEDFWALKDINFEIKRGEVVGIIGRNGAGKSTLLKILSRITEPSEGRVTIKGRVASLLEVGTGFHPELTGRENIYLNGAILGMTRAEIRKKFDEIVAFAEVEKFLDTPVKRYSSGMYVRLAFAVAAHLEPEILVVDEVLAVGDVEFQKKCLGKMKDVAGHGRTVLFVSHNMWAIRKLCTSGIYLQDGSISLSGGVNKIIDAYVGKVGNTTSKTKVSRSIIINTFDTHLQYKKNNLLSIKLEILMTFEQECRLNGLCVIINSENGTRISIIDTRDQLGLPVSSLIGSYKVIIYVDSVNYVDGRYAVDLYIESDEFTGDIKDVCNFDILNKKGSGKEYDLKYQGVCKLNYKVMLNKVG